MPHRLLPPRHHPSDRLTRPVCPWRLTTAPLVFEATARLWVLALLDLAFGEYLIATRSGVAPCSGPLCSIVTLGDHPTLTLVLAEASAAVLVVTLPLRGASATSGPRLGAIVAASVCGAVALSGVAALVLGTALCFLFAIGVLLFVIDRL